MNMSDDIEIRIGDEIGREPEWHGWIGEDWTREENVPQPPWQIESLVRGRGYQDPNDLTPEMLTEDLKFIDTQVDEGRVGQQEVAPWRGNIERKRDELREAEERSRGGDPTTTQEQTLRITSADLGSEQPQQQTPERNSDINSMPYLRVKSEMSKLKRIRPQDRTRADKERFRALRDRENQLFSVVEDSGGFDDVRDDLVNPLTRLLGDLRRLESDGRLTEESIGGIRNQIANNLRAAGEYERYELDDEVRGVRGEFARTRINKIQSQVDSLRANSQANKGMDDEMRREFEEMRRQQQRTADASERQARAAERTANQGATANRDLLNAIRESRNLQQRILDENISMRQAQGSIAQSTERQTELMMRDISQMIFGESNRGYVNPERFDQELPFWYRQLTDQDRGMIRTRLWLNYISALKQDNGMTSFDTVAKDVPSARVQMKDIAYMFKDRAARIEQTAEGVRLVEQGEGMPGFRIAMATFIKDLFVEGQNHFVFSDRGIALFDTDSKRDDYREKKIRALTKMFEGRAMEFRARYHSTEVTPRDIATAAVSAVDNLFFATGVYDSADEKRRLKPGQSSVYSEQFRAFYMPARKIVDRFNGGRAFGGDLGTWLLDNAKGNVDNSRSELLSERQNYMPYRLFYSMFDHTKMSGGRYKFLSEALVSAPKSRPTEVRDAQGSVIDTVYDFQAGDAGVSWNQAEPSELVGYYGDKKEKAIALYMHLKGEKREHRFQFVDDIIDALLKLEGDERIKGMFDNRDFLTAIMALYISPNKGFVRGSTTNLLDIDEGDYENRVRGALEESPRLYDAMPRGMKKELYRRFMADPPSRRGILSSFIEFYGYLNPLNRDTPFYGNRNRARASARRQVARWTRGR
jgi:hypothetical protein